ncbi:hypothetical protein OQA88_1710 [Cercophora sp. LCS_1]
MSPQTVDAAASNPATVDAPPRRPDLGFSIWRRLQTLEPPQPKAPSYPLVASIPRTPSARLTQPDAVPFPFPSEPVLAPAGPAQPETLLYLAYGSNLSSEVFLGRRGIRPISRVNVSAPSLRLVFDLAGLPYREPCFANTAIRKIPGTPPKLPPGAPDIPDLPDPPPFKPPHHSATGDPTWDGGLIGVVYEVTRSDFAKIMATEGGGASYREILVPCLALPPTVGVPEKPPVPELPKPFIARTLYAPRLPDVPNDGDKDKTRDGGDDDDDDGDEPEMPEPPSWFKKLLLPVRRPDPDYAQPSARYLGLITEGAKEHDLPGAYQEYLGSLKPYTITTCRQRVGQVLFLLFWAPLFIIVLFGGKLFADDEGKVPTWLSGMMTVVFNLVWMSYDAIAKPIFGDGERTIEDGDDVGVVRRQRRGSLRWLRGEEACDDEEKRGLLASANE